ncbi:MAG TPA: nuclear transport factor 2 family protein [Chitinophagaceae bacterium]
MKKNLLFLTVLALLFACNNASETGNINTEDTSPAAGNAGPADTAQARKDLNVLLDSIDNAFKRKDMAFMNYMSKDGIYMGTDPGEIMNYDDFHNFSIQSFRDTTIKTYDFTVNRREIRIHGASANFAEQYFFPAISTKVMVRNVGHARYENNRWIVDMYTFNVVPKNEDLLRMDKVL